MPCDAGDAVQELNRALTMAGLQEPKLAPQRSTLVSCHQHWHLVLPGVRWSELEWQARVPPQPHMDFPWYSAKQLSYRGFIGHFGHVRIPPLRPRVSKLKLPQSTPSEVW